MTKETKKTEENKKEYIGSAVYNPPVTVQSETGRGQKDFKRYRFEGGHGF